MGRADGIRTHRDLRAIAVVTAALLLENGITLMGEG